MWRLIQGCFVTTALMVAVACGGGGGTSVGSNGTTPTAPTVIPGVFRANRATQTQSSQGAAPTTGTSITMSTPRVYHSAVKLANGDLMIVGGASSATGVPSLASAEIFSAGSEGFSSAGNMSIPRLFPAVARLSDGRVVVLGGFADYVVTEPFAIDVYSGGTWSKAPCTVIDQRDIPFYPSVAIGLPNSKILYYGGASWGTPNPPNPLPKEFHDPRLIDTTVTPWKVTTLSTDPIHHRVNFAHLILRDGTIMISGGGGGIVIFNPETLTFTEHQMAVGRSNHGMIQHPDGKVQIYGGLEGAYHETSVETYDPATGQSVVVGNLRQGRGLMGSNLLQNGETLHGGGPDANGHASPDQVTYNYNTNVSLFTSQMLQPRVYFVSMALNNGRVVYIGGTTTNLALSTAEIFDSYSAIMINTPSDTLKLGQTMQVELISGGPVDWTCTKNTGEISASGLYTAPPPNADPEANPTYVVITATSKTDMKNKVNVTIMLVP